MHFILYTLITQDQWLSVLVRIVSKLLFVLELIEITRDLMFQQNLELANHMKTVCSM